jgi:probable F420-dependent oxidoreductase
VEIGADPSALRDFAQGAEELGFDYILAYEHVLGVEKAAFPNRKFIYGHQDAFHEPLTTFSFLAAHTSTIEFATGILVLPQRDVRLVAKQATQLALLSGGRFRLGVGAGWNQAEAESLGTNFRNRGKRMDEQLALLHRLFREPLLDFEGEFHHLHRVGINPLPPKPPEIWIGGSADAVLMRAARFGDGWMPATLPPGKLQEMLDTLHRYLGEAGRDPADFGIDARMVLAAFPEDTWSDEFERWKKLGASHFRCNTMGLGHTKPEQHLNSLKRFQEAI